MVYGPNLIGHLVFKVMRSPKGCPFSHSFCASSGIGMKYEITKVHYLDPESMSHDSLLGCFEKFGAVV